MTNIDKRLFGKRTRHSSLSRQITLQYFLALAGVIAILLLLFFFAIQVCEIFTWQAYDPLYQFLKLIQETSLFWLVAVILIGWSIITYRFFQKPIGYLDEVIEAAEHLAQPDAHQIVLSEDMKGVQDELNMVREQALRNAMAAKEAEQRKNDLVIYLAHDLKTPLTSVIGYLTLLHDEPQISENLRSKYTDIALTKAERLEDLINEFFDITRFNLSHLTLEPETVNLTRMLEQTTFEFNPILSEKSLSWDLQLAPDVQIVCDPDKLERVFDNLIRNAVNYSYPNTMIRVALFPSKEYVTVRVENHGRTISAEKLERIFEQFFRLDSSRSSTTGGSGLGLAIAKEIVELHNGTIKAESADERILFTVVLPLNCQKNV